MKYVIMGSNSYHQIELFGTFAGNAYNSYTMAEKRLKKLEEEFPRIDFMVVGIEPHPLDEDKPKIEMLKAVIE